MADPMRTVLRAFATTAFAAIILNVSDYALYAKSPAWPKTCVSTIGETYRIGRETDGWPNECLLSETEWANCLEKAKPFADDPKLLADAERHWRQECHEALLTKFPDADKTQSQRKVEVQTETDQDTEWVILLVVVAIAVICLVAIGIWIAAPIIIPFALLVIALHFLGCF